MRLAIEIQRSARGAKELRVYINRVILREKRTGGAVRVVGPVS